MRPEGDTRCDGREPTCLGVIYFKEPRFAATHPGGRCDLLVKPGNLQPEYKKFVYCDDLVARETPC
jgi:hypothetical protein